MNIRIHNMMGLLARSAAVLAVITALPGAAGDPPVAVEAAPPDEALPPATPAPAPALEPVAAAGDTLLRMANELAALKEQFRQLQETLDLLVGQMMADLERENEELRQEVRRLHARYGPEPTEEAPPIPRPGGELIEQVLAEPEPEVFEAPAEFGYTVADEWGRTPEVAAEMGGEASSLKGMVGVVPPNSAPEDLEELARELRSQYAEYDNINIEVFDSAEAAQSYLDNNVSDPARRVLSISKHRASGRDLLLRIENGVTFEIPF